MKKKGLLNPGMASLLSRLGHTDEIVICDAGLPIPGPVERIDLILKKGVPSFLETMDVMLDNMEVEEAIIAKEMEGKSIRLWEEVEERMEEKGITVHKISHEAFKERTQKAKGVIRTGECTPYANIILKAGVIF